MSAPSFKRVRTETGSQITGRSLVNSIFNTCDAIDRNETEGISPLQMIELQKYGNSFGLRKGTDWKTNVELCDQVRPRLAESIDSHQLTEICSDPDSYIVIKWLAKNVYGLEEGVDYFEMDQLCEILPPYMDRFPLTKLPQDLIGYISRFLPGKDIASLLASGKTVPKAPLKKEAYERLVEEYRKVCPTEIDCRSFFLGLTLLHDLTPRNKSFYESTIHNGLIDPNKLIRFVYSSNRETPDYKYTRIFKRDPIMYPDIDVFRSYLGLAVRQGNRGALDILIKYGAKPYPSMEDLLATFADQPQVYDILNYLLETFGPSKPIDQYSLFQLQEAVNLMDPDEAKPFIDMLRPWGYNLANPQNEFLL